MSRGLLAPIDKGLGVIYETLGRPSYAVGHLLAGDPGRALGTLFAPRRLRPEEKKRPSQALGMKGIPGRFIDVATDPVLWAGLYGLKKIPIKAGPQEARINMLSRVGAALDDAKINTRPNDAALTMSQRKAVITHLQRLDLPRTLRRDLIKSFTVPGKGPIGQKAAAKLTDDLAKMVQEWRVLPEQQVADRADMVFSLRDHIKALPVARKGEKTIAESLLLKDLWEDLSKVGLGGDNLTAWGGRPPRGRLARLTPEAGEALKVHIAQIKAQIPPVPAGVGWIARQLGDARSALYRTGSHQIILTGEHNYHASTTALEKHAAARIIPGIKEGTPLAAKLWKAMEDPKVRATLTPDETATWQRLRSFLREIGIDAGVPATAMAEMEKRGGYINHIMKTINKEGELPIALLNSMPNESVFWSALQRRHGLDSEVKDIVVALKTYIRGAMYRKHVGGAVNQLERLILGMSPTQQAYTGDLIRALQGGWSEAHQNLVASLKSLGWKGANPRDVATLMRKMVSVTYLGALGANVGPTVRNLTQNANSVAHIGLHWWNEGRKLVKTDWGRRLVEESGVLGEYPHLDQIAGTGATAWEKVKKVLMGPFSAVERYNRSSTFLGSYLKAAAKGIPKSEAIAYGRDITELTQFGYTAGMSTPAHRRVDVKALLQFTTFPTKQSLMFYNWWRGKRWDALARYAGLTSWLVYAARSTVGVDFSNTFGTGIYPAGFAPIPNMAFGLAQGVSAGDWDRFERSLPLFIPGGLQGKKAIDFIETAKEGWQVYDERGRLRYRTTAVDAVKRALGLRPQTASEDIEYKERVRRLRDQYRTVKQDAIQALIDGRPRDAEVAVGRFTADTGIPVVITPAALKSAWHYADMTAAERLEASLPRAIRKQAQQWKPPPS